MGSTAPLSEEYGIPLPHFDQKPCMWRDFRSHLASTPDALAIACVHQSPGLFGLPNLPLDDEAFTAKPYLRWSYRTLYRGIERLVGAWRPLGVKEGTPVVTFVQNSAESVLACYAAMNLGCVLISLSPRNLTNEEEVRHMVKTGLSVCNGERPVVITGDEHLAFQVDELGLFADAVRIILGSSRFSDWSTFQSLMDQSATATMVGGPLSPSVPEKSGSVMFTSGTTSLPKGIYHLYSTWATACAVKAYLKGRMVAGDRLICNLPNNHAMGFVSVTNSLAVGAGVVFPAAAFDPEMLLETLYRERITNGMLVPTMLHALVAVKAARYPDRPLSDLKNVTFGGASLSLETVNLAIRELGARGAENMYGCTEGAFTSSDSQPDFSKIADGHDVSVGWPLPGYGVRIADPETAEILPRGALGEIHACGPSVDGPYIGGVGAQNWYEDGGRLWYKTGDAGRMDAMGRTFITGRYKDM